ncbi:MAG: fumarylacetoacetate hydrolase family protein, partial [Chloroflexi bacterium]
MKLVDFSPDGDAVGRRLGVVIGQQVHDIGRHAGVTLQDIIGDEALMAALRQYTEAAGEGEAPTWGSETVQTWPLDDVRLFAPLSQPPSLRDFYAFEQHVKTANANRGRPVPQEWYEVPVFYFSNHRAIYHPDDVIPYPTKSEALDYELEVACVISKAGRNINVAEAEDYIFGFMIFNDWSARDIQRQEMRVGLGPAKGKDFASS